MIFGRNKPRKRNSVLGLDLGSQQIKAVVLSREDSGLKLAHYAVTASAAGPSKTGSAEKLGNELHDVLTQLGISERNARVAVSCPSATICEAEFPRMPLSEVRSALRLPINCTRYLRRDLSGFS